MWHVVGVVGVEHAEEEEEERERSYCDCYEGEALKEFDDESSFFSSPQLHVFRISLSSPLT